MLAAVFDEVEARQQAEVEGISHITVGIAAVREGQVLVVRRAAHEFLGGHYELPGGGVEAEESFVAAALRELKEETGLEAQKILGTFDGFDYSTDKKPHVRQINFLVEASGNRVRLDPEEHDAYLWVDAQQLQKLAMTENMRLCVSNALELASHH